jgi:hypothetical protein
MTQEELQSNPDNAQSADDNVEIEYIIVHKKRSPLQKLGCLVGLLCFLIIGLIPITFLVLANEGNITISYGDNVPDSHEHPRFQLSLVSEIDFRGFQITQSSIHRIDETHMCLQTNVRYLLWEGDGEAAEYCDCYSRSDEDADWGYVETTFSTCR